MQIDKPMPPFVRFEQVAIEDRNASIEAGRYVSRDVDMAFIMQRGAKDVVEKVATEWLAQIKRQAGEGTYDPEWADGYQKKFDLWKQGIEQAVSGTSIRQALFLSPAQMLNYIGGGVNSLEELAQLSEQAMQNFGAGARDHKAQAAHVLEAANSNDKLRAQVAALEAKIEALTTEQSVVAGAAQAAGVQTRADARQAAQRSRAEK